MTEVIVFVLLLGMLFLILLSIFTTPDIPFELREVARIPGFAWGRYVCGDADHDGKQEIYMMLLRGPDWTSYIMEYTADWQFDSFPLGYIQTEFLDIGDADQDRKTDLLMSYPESLGCRTCVLESADSASLPFVPVWRTESTVASITSYGKITDLDADSARELTFTPGNNEIQIYECTGPDRYSLVYEIPGRARFTQTPDLDRDGIPELLASRFQWAYFYESVADDSWVVKDSFFFGLWSEIKAVAAATDMDRDGRNEAIAYGGDIDDFGYLAVIESPSNDTFDIVWSTQFPVVSQGGSLAVGDLDGDSIPEIAVDASGIRFFRCTGNDQYEQFYYIEQGDLPTIYDINSDGKNELIYHYRDSLQWTIICECVGHGLVEQQHKALEQVKISPSIVAKGNPVLFDQLPEGARVEILDITGRVLAEPDRLWQTRAINPGAYFVRLKLGSQTLTRKLLVVK